VLQKALKKGGPVLRFLEGIISKKLTSRYKSGACRSWLKVKNPAYERRGLSVRVRVGGVGRRGDGASQQPADGEREHNKRTEGH